MVPPKNKKKTTKFYNLTHTIVSFASNFVNLRMVQDDIHEPNSGQDDPLSSKTPTPDLMDERYLDREVGEITPYKS